MKLLTNIMTLGMLCLGSYGALSCNDDHKPDWTEPSTHEVHAVSSSLENGTTITPLSTDIEVRYSALIALNSLVSPLLNDTEMKAAVSADDGTVLIVSLTGLQPNKDYTLTLPSRLVAGVGSGTFAPEYSVAFRTGDFVPSGPVTPTDLCNANADAATRNVYNYLVANHGVKILSGAMANVSNNADFAGWIRKVTGKDVAIQGYDFIHLPESASGAWIDYSDISSAREHWTANGIVSYMWHWRVPTDEKAYKEKDYDRYGFNFPGENVEKPTEFDIDRALEEGTWEHEVILADIDKAASYLKLLQEAGIPVIWRPLHEAAGSYRYGKAWFWWGGKNEGRGASTIALWKLMYDRMVNHHGLNNLIWVWTAQYEEGHVEQMLADYPGNDCVDIVGVDVYADNDESQVKAFNALFQMTGGKKLITLSETGRVQNPEKCFADKAYWSWFNLWYSYDIHKTDNTADNFGNTAESLGKILSSPLVVTREQLPSFR